eukprot:c10829_g2_i1.p1 GENE.c10829_g2_i1~~c10829_g2_i1.p1  ORF type:complete len:375 (+),score=136.70 c10829_g2_i1:35-1126(+)
MSDKPKVLVLGGVGFVGRNFVKYLVDNELASLIRVVDKAMPITSFMSPLHQAAFDNPIVQFKQGDLSREATVDKSFALDDGSKFDYVVNLVSETKYSQSEETYEKNIFKVAQEVGKGAQKFGVKKFVELSHAAVYEPKNKHAKEDHKIDPWTIQAKYKIKSEQHLQTLGLPLVILRPAIIYGPADLTGISPRLICARVYKHKNQKMKFLWSGDLRINTVHVHDVARAIWHSCLNVPAGSVFNLADKSDTSQGSLNTILEQLFGIETGFQAALASQAAQLAMKSVAAEINDQHLGPWSEICQAANIPTTPLTPYLDVELLYNKHMSVSGEAIEATGFTYEKPLMTFELVKEQYDLFVDQKLFPN